MPFQFLQGFAVCTRFKIKQGKVQACLSVARILFYIIVYKVACFFRFSLFKQRIGKHGAQRSVFRGKENGSLQQAFGFSRMLAAEQPGCGVAYGPHVAMKAQQGFSCFHDPSEISPLHGLLNLQICEIELRIF